MQLFKLKIKDLDEKLIIALFILFQLILALYPFNYGIFRDEFLYLSMSDHLDWGYLEVPPLPGFILAVVRAVMGTSQFSLHIVPAVLGSIGLVLIARMVKEMGGGRFAVILALVCALFAGQYVATGSVYTYECFDRFFWTLVFYFIVKLLSTQDKKYWIFFGIAAGLGLMSKITMLYLGFGLFGSFLLTRDRKLLWDKRFFIGGGIAVFIFLPFILWQAYYGFPIFEYLARYTAKVYKASPLEFFTSQILVMNPMTFPVWLAGIGYFLFHSSGKKYRVLGLAYLIMMMMMMAQQVKYYLLTSYYPVLFAGGAVFFAKWMENRKISFLKPVFVGLIALLGIAMVPITRPVLSPENFIRYTAVLGGRGRPISETSDTAVLPQLFADRFGWEEMAQKVSKIYQGLSPEEQKIVTIFAGNYGEAGALHFYRTKYGYSDPICPNNVHWIWGPGDHTGELMIIVGDEDSDQPDLEKSFESVQLVDRIDAPYSMPYENHKPIYLCRKLKMPLKEVWKNIKKFG